MKVNDSSDIMHFEYKSISPQELEKLWIPSEFGDMVKRVVKINGKYYYAKLCRSNELVSELIGSYLCELIGLDAVDYQIGTSFQTENFHYALSEIFYKDGYLYFTPYDFFDTKPDNNRIYSKKLKRFYICETSVIGQIKNPKMVESILKMTAVDIKMGQIDRHNYNVMLRCSGSGMADMEKLFDFGGAYESDPPYPEYYCYDNPFLIVRKNTISLMTLANNYPLIKESAATLSHIPLYDVLKEIEKRFNVQIEDKDIPRYLDMDKKFNKILRKIK